MKFASLIKGPFSQVLSQVYWTLGYTKQKTGMLLIIQIYSATMGLPACKNLDSLVNVRATIQPEMFERPQNANIGRKCLSSDDVPVSLSC